MKVHNSKRTQMKSDTFKILLLPLILIFAIVSCSKKSEETFENKINGKWELVRMTGSFENTETAGADMEWNETYTFNANGTFAKTRTAAGVQSSATGKYSLFTDAQGVHYVQLEYDSASPLVGGCYSDVNEELYFTADHLLSSTWRNCDGPGLDYRKIE